MGDDRARAREEWLEQRRGGIGGSDAAALFGVHPWMSRYTLYLDKLGQLPPQEYKAILEVGNALEPLTRELFTARTGKSVRPNTENIVHPKYPWMRATVDGYLEDDTIIFEGKTTSISNQHDWADGRLPLYYQIQGTHYMLCTGTKRAVIAVLVLGRKDPLEVRDFPLNESFARKLLSAEKRFWHDHVLAKVAPEIDSHSATTEALKRIHPEDSGMMVAFDDRSSHWMDEANELEDVIKRAKLRLSTIKNSVMDEMGDATWATTPDGRGWSWKMSTTKAKSIPGYTSRTLRRHGIKAMGDASKQAEQTRKDSLRR